MLQPSKNLTEHHLTVTRTARFYTIGPTDGKAERVWIVCHGYNQLAAEFIGYFEGLDDGKTLIIAPEALSRFYVDRFAADASQARKVGASWMTREDRLTEIEDYVAYLTALYDHITSTISRGDLTLTVLGFSQGCATVSRWVAKATHPVDRLILWGGSLPPDLDLTASGERLRAIRLVLVVGREDELIGAEAITEEEARLKEHRIGYELIRFDGGHQLHRRTLLDLAD